MEHADPHFLEYRILETSPIERVCMCLRSCCVDKDGLCVCPDCTHDPESMEEIRNQRNLRGR